MRDAILKARNEMIKLASENEQRVHEKCAQVVLAASGLSLLQKKMTPTLNKQATETGE